MSDNDIPNSRYFEWQEDPWGEGHLRAAEGLDLSATQRGEDEFERVEVKGKWYLSGAFQPAPRCYIGEQYDSFLCDGRYLINCVPGGSRVALDVWGGIIKGGAYIIFLGGMLTNIFVALVTGENFLPWQDNLPEDLIYIRLFTYILHCFSISREVDASRSQQKTIFLVYL